MAENAEDCEALERAVATIEDLLRKAEAGHTEAEVAEMHRRFMAASAPAAERREKQLKQSQTLKNRAAVHGS